MNRQEVLLKEYELCQQENHHLANQYWLVVGVFMSVNTALLGAIAYSIVSSGTPPSARLWPFLALGLGVIIILHYLKLSRRRVDFRISVNYERMREIEEELEMWKNWRIYGLDLWKDDDFDENLSGEIKKRLAHYHPKEWWKRWVKSHDYMRPVGRKAADAIFNTLMALWVLFIVVSLVSIIFLLFWQSPDP